MKLSQGCCTFVDMDAREVLAALEADPALRAEARRLVLTDELLGLPALVAENSRQITALTAGVDGLAAVVGEQGRQIGALTAGVDALAAVVEEQGRQITGQAAALDQTVSEIREIRAILGRFITATGRVLERIDATLLDHTVRLQRIEESLA
jgi:ABC-type transporter Mla subunit MlaD